MLLAFDGVVLLFHLDHIRVLKEIKSYLQNYGFRYGWSGLWWTHCHLWVMRTQLSRFHLNPLNSICIFFLLNFIWNLFLILQTFLNCATFFVKNPNVTSLGIGIFFFSSPLNEFVNNSIDVQNEDMLYNWTNRASMSISKVGRPFRVAKEMDLATI